jgi:hypothetical protein
MERVSTGAGHACTQPEDVLQASPSRANPTSPDMYKIIGADKKEYGPVTTEQLRQWFVEGRVNGQTMVRLETETDWKTMASLPEFADLLRGAESPAAPSFLASQPGPAAAPIEQVLARDYELDIGSCISRSWELVRAHFWPVIGISALIMIISAAVNQVLSLGTGPAVQGMIREHRVSALGISLIFGTSILGSPVYTLLTAGTFKYYLRLIRGEPATIADAFAGFSPLAGQLILLGLVTGILNMIGFALCIIPGIYLSVSWIFALPLVVDRRLGFWDAMQLSRKVVAKHWFMTFAFMLVIGLLGACGVIACCIGVLVTIPISLVALMYAYEDIFNRQGV